MIAIIRIRGMVDVNSDVQETLSRLKLRRKYVCVIIEENEVLRGMLKKVRNEIAYGKIDDETLKELIKQRGQKIDKKKEIKPLKGLDFEESNLKPFFRLHPPRGGIKSKEHFPKGVLGNHKGKINDLIRRML
ncbi:50S ribosomal protein L30 [Candidatus Pacearchaeota archaeon CG10_big_fil_rev_8_21_14_0_10_30_48]|nr:MAG: 50S ribosomal protein L30 [Candidatus Pacearchaeota archaeon CG10_big_fil_rev_8_21_14_0_10_30_48]